MSWYMASHLLVVFIMWITLWLDSEVDRVVDSNRSAPIFGWLNWLNSPQNDWLDFVKKRSTWSSDSTCAARYLQSMTGLTHHILDVGQLERWTLSGYLQGISSTEGVKVKHPISLAKIWPIIGHNLETIQDRRWVSINH